MNWINSLILMILSKIPLINMLKPIWKSALKALIQKEGDVLQAKLDGVIDQDGPMAIDRLLAEFQVKVVWGLGYIPMPITTKEQLTTFIIAHATDWAASLKLALASGGRIAFDNAFDLGQEALLARVDSF